jgi:predicted nucleic acid-binding protein
MDPTTPWEPLDLDAGEAAAIALARELGANSLLMDERKGVAIARGMGLVVERTPTVLAIAAERGLIDLNAAFARLKATNFRVPPALLDQLLAEFQRRRA